MEIIKAIVFSLVITLLVAAHPLAAKAAYQQQAGKQSTAATRSGQPPSLPLEKREIDGYTISVHLMKITPEMNLDGSHTLLVRIEDQNRLVENAVVNSKVIAPDGRYQTKVLKEMGDWHLSSFELDQPGQHYFQLVFRTADGARHQAGVFYGRTP